MITDDIENYVNAVEEEITKASLPKEKKKTNMSWLVVAALVLFIIVELSLHHNSQSSIESDLSIMLQQARHEVLDYYHSNGRLPDQIKNPALRPYIRYQPTSQGKFTLIGTMGETKQILIEGQ